MYHDFFCILHVVTFQHLSPMTEWSRELDYLSLAVFGVGSNPARHKEVYLHSLIHKNGNRRYKSLVLGRKGPYFVKE